MKYPKIASLVPAGEHFDESAIVNEGGYLSTSHLAAVEKKITDDAAAIAAHPGAVQKLNDQITESNTAMKTAEDSLVTANSSIEANKKTIADLQTEVARLNKLTPPPASTKKEGTDTVVVVAEDTNKKYRTSFDDMHDAYHEKK